MIKNTIINAVIWLDIFTWGVMALLLWFINGTEPAIGYKVIYVICGLNAAAMLWTKKRSQSAATLRDPCN